MTWTKLITIIALAMLTGAMLYQHQMPTPQPSPAIFMRAIAQQGCPAYLAAVPAIAIDTLLPTIGVKALTNTMLPDVLRPDGLYKIIKPEDLHLAKANDCIALSPLDRNSGFIHLSYGAQIESTISKFFADAPMVLVIEIDQKALETHKLMVKNEQNKPNGPFYPHLYGTLAIPRSVIRSIIECTNKQGWVVSGITIIP